MAATIATRPISSSPLPSRTHRVGARSPYVVVLPPAARRPQPVIRAGRPAGPVALAPRPSHTVYLRRRVLVALVMVLVSAIVWLGAGRVLASSASADATGAQATPAQVAAPSSIYVARQGDTMWSIAARFAGQHRQVDYVNMLIDANGGAFIRSGQAVILP